MSSDIFLNIDTIVLRGMHQIDRHALAEAVREVLLEQLAAGAGLTAAELPRVRTNITLPSGFNSEQLGQILGHSLSKVISNTHAPQNPANKTLQGGQYND